MDFKKQLEVTNKLEKWASDYGIGGLKLLESSRGYLPMRDEKPFVPVMRLRLDVAQLRLLVLALSDYLSEPHRQQVRQPSQSSPA